MVSDRNESESGRNRKLLLGIGFFVQGMRCFPWMGVDFFLKDGLRVEPSTLQILQISSNLPMVAKPFYGILSDSLYIFGQHRVPYIALGAPGLSGGNLENVEAPRIRQREVIFELMLHMEPLIL
ncbi:hypothetical protein ACS0TY_034546 [Phlomoides rotata]